MVSKKSKFVNEFISPPNFIVDVMVALKLLYTSDS